jgi:cytochrome c553
MLKAFRIRENRVPRILLLTLFFPTVLVANLSCQEHPPKHSGSTRPPIRQMAGAKDAFESLCASCHGLDGNGGRGPHTGVTGMPTDYASSLTATELDDLVSFLIEAARSENPKENPHVSPVFEDGDEE